QNGADSRETTNEKFLAGVPPGNLSFNRLVVKAHSPSIDSLRSAIGKLNTAEAKSDVSSIIRLVQLTESLGSRRDHEFTVTLVIVLDCRHDRRLHRGAHGRLKTRDEPCSGG